MNDQDFAIREGEQNAAEAAYFDNRPQIDTNDRRRVFDAGFQRGWDAAAAAERERLANHFDSIADKCSVIDLRIAYRKTAEMIRSKSPNTDAQGR